MANKQKKKRNKTYRGADAAMTRPVVTRVSAVSRSKFGQWWFEHKKMLKPVLTVVGIGLVVIVIIIGIISVVTH